MCRVRSGQSEDAGGGDEHWETIPQLFLTSVMVYFTCRQGHSDTWWFIGAQSGAGLNDSQDHENGTMAEYVALWLLMWHHWRL